ncbi:MAG TPA: cytochrome c oxidase subunit II [Streptosporangiaceae bacterium]|nr:cytochrome c oxidase subunit II [Streptosporangiaceae bacterium]
MSHSTTTGSAPEARHGLRIFLIWLPLAIIADVLIWFVWYPHLPPGRMSDQAQGQQFDIAVMAVLAAPVLLFVWVYATYALVTWRRKAGDDEDATPIRGNTRVQATWITATAVIVLGLFVFGTVQLIVPAGAGAGEGPSPIWKPDTNRILQVQVIGQQWAFTYRYPQFGGMESTMLELPVGEQIQFNVTSLDVIHSFWPYLLGVKADANPGVNNVAFAKAQQLGRFVVRCNELCGIWHGAMFNYGRVVTPTTFVAWARSVEAREARLHILTALPPYALTYDPTVIPQLGQDIVKVAGITGAGGYYYPSESQSGDPGDPESP